MKKAQILKIAGLLIAGIAVGWFVRGMFGGGGGPPMGMMQMPPATVRVLPVQEQLLSVADEYIASVEPLQEVMLRPEVSGRIKAIHFTEGSFVEAGDLLFTIDQASYQADANAAEAELRRTEKRYNRLKKADARSVSASDLESAESDYLRANAAYDLAMVDLEYTEIKAPVSGRIGAAMVKKGNYVSAGSEGLARIVQLDPIRVVFSQTDRDYLKLRKRELVGSGVELEARAVLPDGSVFPNIGKKDFDDNAIDPMTGTIAVRYLFDNPDGLLMPGAYIKARISNPAGERGIKIPQRAVLIDQNGSYVMTVDTEGTVHVVRIVAGDQIEGDVIVLSGLAQGDQVVTDGIQKARPGATVVVVGTEVSK